MSVHDYLRVWEVRGGQNARLALTRVDPARFRFNPTGEIFQRESERCTL